MSPRDGEAAARAPTSRSFEEPWQAKAFAMTVALHERGVFTWSEWAETLSAVKKLKSRRWRLLRVLAARRWKSCWRAKGVAGARARSTHWPRALERAAHATPHGQPILLENDPEGPQALLIAPDERQATELAGVVHAVADEITRRSVPRPGVEAFEGGVRLAGEDAGEDFPRPFVQHVVAREGDGAA